MTDDSPGDESPLPAGGYAAWLAGMDAALRGDRDADVPCDGCTACCASSQFVHIGPDEIDALAHIPAELLFPAPRLPAGHVLMGYDEHGRCPMLAEGGCSIYEHRPRTCRTYDCRVFPATGVAPDDDKPAIARRAGRWRFDVSSEADRAARDAVWAAARYVRDRRDELSADDRPATATQHAVVAIRLRGRFADDPGHARR
jgi:uncharacterized protein